MDEDSAKLLEDLFEATARLEESEKAYEASLAELNAGKAQARTFFETAQAYYQDQSEGWFRGWMLSLAVGNGGGFLTLGAALANGWKLGIWIVLVPPLWLFAGGLLLAGTAPLLRSIHHRRLQNVAEVGQMWLDADSDDVRDRREKKMRIGQAAADRFHWRAYAVAITSAALFVTGLAWPITVLTLWLFNAVPAAVSWPYPPR